MKIFLSILYNDNRENFYGYVRTFSKSSDYLYYEEHDDDIGKGSYISLADINVICIKVVLD